MRRGPNTFNLIIFPKLFCLVHDLNRGNNLEGIIQNVIELSQYFIYILLQIEDLNIEA